MFDRNLMKLPGMPAIMAALLVLAPLQAAAVFGQVWFLAGALSMLWEGIALEQALPNVACFFACFALLNLLRFGQETMLDRFSQRRAESLRDELLSATFDDEALLAVRQGAARVSTMLGSGIDEVQTYVRIIPPKIVGMVAVSIPLLVAVFAIDWVSGVILAVMFPVIIFFMILLGKQAAARAERQYGAYTRLSNRFIDTLRGLPVLRAFGAARVEGCTMHAYSERLRHATVRTLTTATLSSAVLDLCATFGVAAVAMMLAFRLMDGSMQLFGALSALMLAPEYFAPIRAFASDYHASLDGKNALADALGLIGSFKQSTRNAVSENASAAEGAEAPNGANALGDETSCSGAPTQTFGTTAPQGTLTPFDATKGIGDETPAPLRPWDETSTISFEGITLRYSAAASAGGEIDANDGAGSDAVGTAETVVGPFTFDVSGTRRVALIGKSGAGKSTLAGIIAGMLHPSGGRILVDGSPADLTDASWKDQVRIIPQQPYIFRATLADNVRFYAPDATDDEVARAICAVGLNPLVTELPRGLQTVIGEGARGLSGGQAHRVALARMLLDRRARVLVFDEPTAHLDIQTELELKPVMLEAMRGKLVFFATHRLHWTHDMDMIVDLSNGTCKCAIVQKNQTLLHVDSADATPITSPIPQRRSETAGGSVTSAILQHQLHNYSNVSEAKPMCAPTCGFADNRVGHEGLMSQKNQDDVHLETHTASAAESNSRKRAAKRTPPPRWFSQFIGRYKRSVVVALALGLVASGFSALLMFASGFLISATAQPGITLFAIMVPIAFVQIFGLGRPFAHYLERLVSHDWVLKVTSDLRLMLYDAIERRIEDPALARATGEYLGLLDDDIAHLQNLYLRVVFPAAIAVLLAIGACMTFAFFSAKLVALMLVSLAVCVVALPYASLLIAGAKSREAKRMRAAEYPALADDVGGSRDWVYAKRGTEAVLAHAKSDGAIRLTESSSRLVERAFALASALCLGATSCAIVCWSGSNLANGPGENWIAALALGFFPLIEAFTALPHSLAQITVHEDAVARLDEYLGERNCPDETPRDLDGSAVRADAGDLALQAHDAPLTSATSAISLARITYTYPRALRPALSDISIEIPAGQSVAIIGRSGSGKSTLFHIIRGVLPPQRGAMSILGMEETESDVPKSPGEPLVGYLGQTPYLFNRTLRENLTLGVFERDDDALASALKSVGLGAKLKSLPDGLNTVVGETGVGFSGGEAHRIALARTLVADTPIVLVDEPFSALDPETEQSLLTTLFDVCAEKTLLVVTHHLSGIERFDRIVFVEDGRIALDGTPAELAAQSPLFTALLALE